MCNKIKQSKKKKDGEHRQKETIKALKSARWKYINKLLLIGLNENNAKPVWKYVKPTTEENIGVAPLKKRWST